MYIASVVPDPQDMVSEMKRVCKSGGDLLIVNHFSNCKRLIRASETMLSPLASIIGFRPLFSMDEFILDTSLDVVESIPVNAFGYWTLIRAEKPNQCPVRGAIWVFDGRETCFTEVHSD